MITNKKNIFIVCFFIAILIISFIASNYFKNKAKSKAIHFEVERVEITPSLRCHYYNKNNEKLDLPGHTFFAPSKIERGDIITKKRKSKKIIVYRVDNEGDRYVIDEFKL